MNHASIYTNHASSFVPAFANLASIYGTIERTITSKMIIMMNIYPCFSGGAGEYNFPLVFSSEFLVVQNMLSYTESFLF
jgi:hypothetical protein